MGWRVGNVHTYGSLWTATLIFFGALLVRLVFLALFGWEQRLYDSTFDQNIYVDLANSLLAGRGFSLTFDIFAATAHQPTSIQPPVYPLFLAAMFGVFDGSYLAVRVVQAALGAGICVCAYLIGREVKGESVGVTAGVATAIYPPLVMYVRPLTTEALYGVLLCLLVLLLTRFARGSFRAAHYLLFGLLLSLTFLVRPEAFLFGLLAALFALCWTFLHHRAALRSVTGGVALATLMFYLVALPWALRNLQVHDTLIWGANKRTVLWEENLLRYQRANDPTWQAGRGRAGCTNELNCSIPDFDRLSELERDAYLTRIAQEFIFTHPGHYLGYGALRLLVSYPLIPREELAPPLGYKGVRVRPNDGLDATSLDDHPTYQVGPEKLRVWSFRSVFVLACLGAALATERREWLVLVPLLPVAFNMATAFLLSGKERYRIPIDQFIIVVAAYALVAAVAYGRTSWARVPGLRAVLARAGGGNGGQ